MNYLSAEAIAKSYNDQWLFHDINLGISQGQKLALVGVNGAGKSTLLKILAGQVQPDKGQVTTRSGVRLGLLVQEPAVAPETAIQDVLFDPGNDVARTVREYESCVHDSNCPPERMQEVLDRMESLQAWDYEARVVEVTAKLGIDNLDGRFGELSGGQRKRVFLAQLLLRDPDLLILDEPTNHLDLSAIEWLEKYLSSQQVTLIMVTHDRYFLDNVANEIIELDRGKLYSYKGNYGWFLEKKAEREEAVKAEVDRARNLLRKELEWMRRQPKARGTKAKYRIDAFYELQQKASQEIRRDKLELDVREARQGGKILEVEKLSKHFGDTPIVDNFSYVFKKGDRIGVVGKNGSGKSTFLDLLTGRLTPDGGTVTPGVTTRFGYFTQHAEDLDPANRVIDEVKSIAEFITLSDGAQVSASAFLDMFLFPPKKQYTFVHKLSGGEKKRLQLLKMLVTSPNFLILDEPTNDFDIDTLNVLEEFLEKFQGCLLLVSHDRYFMDHLVDQLFVFEGDGSIRLFNGNYTDYRTWLDEEEASRVETKPERVTPTEGTASRKKASFKEKQEYERLQQEIEQLENRRAALAAFFQQGTTDHEELRKRGEELQSIEKQIDEKTNRWIELAEVIEGA